MSELDVTCSEEVQSQSDQRQSSSMVLCLPWFQQVARFPLPLQAGRAVLGLVGWYPDQTSSDTSSTPSWS